MKTPTNKRYLMVILGLSSILALLFFLSLLTGQFHISIAEAYTVITSRIRGECSDALKIADHVFFNVRLPRIILACLVGGALAISGASLQGAFQNPLVSPDLLGVCAGAGFGAALGILLLKSTSFITPLLSLGMGLASVLIVFFLSQSQNTGETISVILAGIIVASIFNALTSLVKYTADATEKLPAITFWLMGSFSNASFSDIKMACLPVGVGCGGLYLLRWQLNLLSLGNEDSFSLGVNPHTLRWQLVFFSTLATAACVTVSGVIGWIGLVVPHLGRKLVGANHGYLIPASFLIGSIFMLLADFFARNMLQSEIPIGILTALIGAPFFAFMYSRNNKRKVFFL